MSASQQPCEEGIIIRFSNDYWGLVLKKVCERLCIVNFPEEWRDFPFKHVFIMDTFIILFATPECKKYIINYRTICTGQHDLARMFWLIKLISLRQKINCLDNDWRHTLLAVINKPQGRENSQVETCFWDPTRAIPGRKKAEPPNWSEFQTPVRSLQNTLCLIKWCSESQLKPLSPPVMLLLLSYFSRVRLCVTP